MIESLYKAYPILKMINERNKNKLDEGFSFRVLERGEYLRGKECPGLIFIVKGKIKAEKIDLEGRQTNLYEIEEGELCHESLSCHLKCESLEVMGYAVVDTIVAILPKEMIDKYLLNDVEFMQYLYKNLYNKFKTIIGHKESIIHESIEERVLKYLAQKGKNIIYTTHQEIALELGSSREVISRKLKQLENEGYIELGRGKIKRLR
ncbi:MAG: Crp/Fnr family transcriptional regulator [Cellulosilyticaceae bacterium]